MGFIVLNIFWENKRIGMMNRKEKHRRKYWRRILEQEMAEELWLLYTHSNDGCESPISFASLAKWKATRIGNRGNSVAQTTYIDILLLKAPFDWAKFSDCGGIYLGCSRCDPSSIYEVRIWTSNDIFDICIYFLLFQPLIWRYFWGTFSIWKRREMTAEK